MKRVAVALTLAIVVAGLPVSGVICVTLCPGATGATSAPGATAVDAHCHSAASSDEAQFRGAPAAACFELFDAVSARADALRAGRADSGLVVLHPPAILVATAIAPRVREARVGASPPIFPISPPRAPRVLRI